MQELLKTILLSDDSHSRSLNHVVPFTQRKTPAKSHAAGV